MPYADPERQAAFQRAYKNARMRAVSALKSAPCMDCGGSFPSECMHFDHRPGTKKRENLSKMTNRRWADILQEIAKCDLVCANCHAIRTRARLLS